ncbi:MAG: hypothetical protein V2I41_07570 [Pseudomonadales bacterium]|jgi:hypothetical protein|nr:hypothetical protein [Pseudomonadales bacterium]
MSIGDRYTRGPFSFSFESDEPAAYIRPHGQAVVLEGSEDLSGLIDLSNGFALGYDRIWQCYLPEFQRAGWQSRPSGTQMGIWDLNTGRHINFLQGMHLVDVQGAQMIDKEHLLTWGRDYLARTWNFESGDLIEVFALPLGRSEGNGALISCQEFANLSAPERIQFVQQRYLPSPDVQIYAMVTPGSAQLDYGLFPGVQPAAHTGIPLHPPFAELSAPSWVNDMQGAEAGYSTTHILRDGRRLIGGTTYGASGVVYVWDGLFDLTLLLPGKTRECFNILGEVQPGVLEMGEWVAHYDNGPLYRWEI